MKSTGIVRRIDDLGRIVIPREIRHTLEIKEGDAIEIIVEDGNIILIPYSEYDTIVKKLQRMKDNLTVDDINRPGYEAVQAILTNAIHGIQAVEEDMD